MKKKRFVEVFSQGSINCHKVYVDTETGVHYLFVQTGYAGGLTPLLGRDGQPVVTSLSALHDAGKIGE